MYSGCTVDSRDLFIFRAGLLLEQCQWARLLTTDASAHPSDDATPRITLRNNLKITMNHACHQQHPPPASASARQGKRKRDVTSTAKVRALLLPPAVLCTTISNIPVRQRHSGCSQLRIKQDVGEPRALQLTILCQRLAPGPTSHAYGATVTVLLNCFYNLLNDITSMRAAAASVLSLLVFSL